MSTDRDRSQWDNKALALNAIPDLGPDDKKAVALEYMRNLDHSAKAEVARESGVVPPPGQRVTNVIWIMVVTAFALVLLGSTGSLFFSVLASSKTMGLQVLLTVFTTVVGFLAGLLSLSPLQRASPSA